MVKESTDFKQHLISCLEDALLMDKYTLFDLCVYSVLGSYTNIFCDFLGSYYNPDGRRSCNSPRASKGEGQGNQCNSLPLYLGSTVPDNQFTFYCLAL